MWVIVLTSRDGHQDPEAYGPFDEESEAQEASDEMEWSPNLHPPDVVSVDSLP